MAWLGGTAEINDRAKVSGGAKIFGNVRVAGLVHVSYNQTISGNIDGLGESTNALIITDRGASRFVYSEKRGLLEIIDAEIAVVGKMRTGIRPAPGLT